MIFRNLNATRRVPGHVPHSGATGQRMSMTELERVGPKGQTERKGNGEGLLPAPDGELPRLSSQALFRTAREIIIEHDGADYRLRLTANGKLILTK